MAKKKIIKTPVAPHCWSQTTADILATTSKLALLIRNASDESMRDVSDRLTAFYVLLVKYGEEEVLPCSGKTRDVDACLADTDIVNAVLKVIDKKLQE